MIIYKGEKVSKVKGRRYYDLMVTDAIQRDFLLTDNSAIDVKSSESNESGEVDVK